MTRIGRTLLAALFLAGAVLLCNFVALINLFREIQFGELTMILNSCFIIGPCRFFGGVMEAQAITLSIGHNLAVPFAAWFVQPHALVTACVMAALAAVVLILIAVNQSEVCASIVKAIAIYVIHHYTMLRVHDIAVHSDEFCYFAHTDRSLSVPSADWGLTNVPSPLTKPFVVGSINDGDLSVRQLYGSSAIRKWRLNKRFAVRLLTVMTRKIRDWFPFDMPLVRPVSFCNMRLSATAAVTMAVRYFFVLWGEVELRLCGARGMIGHSNVSLLDLLTPRAVSSSAVATLLGLSPLHFSTFGREMQS